MDNRFEIFNYLFQESVWEDQEKRKKFDFLTDRIVMIDGNKYSYRIKNRENGYCLQFKNGSDKWESYKLKIDDESVQLEKGQVHYRIKRSDF